MALNKKHLDQLDQMIAEGVLQATYDGKTLTFASFDELVRRRDYIAARLGENEGGPRVKLSEYDPS